MSSPRHVDGVDMDRVEGIIRNMAHLVYEMPYGGGGHPIALKDIFMWLNDRMMEAEAQYQGRSGRISGSTRMGYMITKTGDRSYAQVYDLMFSHMEHEPGFDRAYNIQFRVFNNEDDGNNIFIFNARLDRHGHLKYERETTSVPLENIEPDLQSFLTLVFPRPEVSDFSSWGEPDSRRRPSTPPVLNFIVSNVGYSLS